MQASLRVNYGSGEKRQSFSLLALVTLRSRTAHPPISFSNCGLGLAVSPCHRCTVPATYLIAIWYSDSMLSDCSWFSSLQRDHYRVSERDFLCWIL